MTDPTGVDGLTAELNSILPDGFVVEAIDNVAGPIAVDELWPIEAEAVERAIADRQQEFALGRVCARRALARLGSGHHPIPVGPNREPIWPDGIVGSIAHTSELVVAIVARANRCQSVGVDIELIDRVGVEILDLILTPPERLVVGEEPDLLLSTIIFSAKESCFKAIFPVTGAWLGFEDVEVIVDRMDGTFTALLPPSAATELVGTEVTGRHTRLTDHVVTAVVLDDRAGQ